MISSNDFQLSYLPLFEDDLNEIIDYILITLRNPTAALRLLDRVESAILKRLKAPDSYASFPSTRPRKNSYYRIIVGNYAIFYVLIGRTMEVRRILYLKRNLDKLLK